MRFIGAPLLLALLIAEPLTAQATALPTFFAPTRAFGSTELGVTLSRPGGGTLGIEGRFGLALNRADLAFRGGYLDPSGGGDGILMAGIEARVSVIGRNESFPLDGAVIFGLGRWFADGGGETFVPLGLSIGRRLSLDGEALQLTPYVQPTFILADDTQAVLGLGLDLRLGNLPEVRLAWGAGDMDGFSVGLFWAG